MSKSCNNCGTDKKPSTVPYAVLEDFKETAKANNRKWFIICLIIFLVAAFSNGYWIWKDSQYEDVITTETYEVNQDAKSGNNSSIINGGEVVNGETNN